VDLAARAFTSVPHRVVTFVLRDAWRLAAGDVDHRRVEWVVPGGAAEPGVAGVLFGAGDEADAIGMLVRPRHGRGSARPGLGQAAGHQPCGCLGLVSCDSAASHTGPCLRGIAWRRGNAVVAVKR
jgi:hypothetical protein